MAFSCASLSCEVVATDCFRWASFVSASATRQDEIALRLPPRDERVSRGCTIALSESADALLETPDRARSAPSHTRKRPGAFAPGRVGPAFERNLSARAVLLRLRSRRRRGEDGEGRAGRRASDGEERGDRKSTRLNSSHVEISYAVFCLK